MDNNKPYKKRLIDSEIEEYLEAFGAVCVEGPKWCGKTWTSAHHAKSKFYIADPKGNYQNRRLANLDVSTILEGKTPRLIDEWQEVPSVWDAVRFEVDERQATGQFILTGSSTPKRDGVFHSGAGRIASIKMNTMSLFEAGNSTGAVSLRDICENKFNKSVLTGEVDLKSLIQLIIRGGWPAGINLPFKAASKLAKQYIEAIVKEDIYKLGETRKNAPKIKLLLRSLARNESTTASNNLLKRDISDIEREDIDIETVSKYLDIFSRLFLIDNQPPFSSNMRSSVRIKQMEKRHFTDPSIACALLGATVENLLGDLNTLGFLFEGMCEHDLKIYGNTIGAKLYHYQDYNNYEIDAILEFEDGSWSAFEIKLGANEIEDAALNLKKIARAFENDPKATPPKSLCVICGMSNAAYKREDGVYVVPITALKN